MTAMAAEDRIHAKCHHRKYRLTCEQIDALRAQAQERCQICGKLERYAAGLLRIDHDKKLGFWAVRGLLCTHCNMGLERGWLVGPEVDEYLANPWHKTLPGAITVTPESELDFPLIDKEAALAQVSASVEPYWQAHGPGKSAQKREARAALVMAVRVAKKVGCRHREIAQATKGTWTPDYIHVVCVERMKQPQRIDAWEGSSGGSATG